MYTQALDIPDPQQRGLQAVAPPPDAQQTHREAQFNAKLDAERKIEPQD